METIAGSGSYSFSRKPLPVLEVTTFSGSYFFQWKPFALLEATRFGGKCSFHSKLSFQWMPLFLVKTIGLQQYSFHLVKTVPFNGRHFLHWKLLLSLEAIHFSENPSFWWKPFLQWKPFLLGKAFVLRGNHCPIFFSGSCSF